jgi:hypothetical protein
MNGIGDMRKTALTSSEADRKAAFGAYLEDPVVRVMMSTIDSGSIPEALRALLEGAFNAGFAVGIEVGIVEIVSKVMRQHEDQKK